MALNAETGLRIAPPFFQPPPPQAHLGSRLEVSDLQLNSVIRQQTLGFRLGNVGRRGQEIGIDAGDIAEHPALHHRAVRQRLAAHLQPAAARSAAGAENYVFAPRHAPERRSTGSAPGPGRRASRRDRPKTCSALIAVARSGVQAIVLFKTLSITVVRAGKYASLMRSFWRFRS